MSFTASHPRTRERLMALYEISLGKSATQVAKDSQWNPQTVMEWVHRYDKANGLNSIQVLEQLRAEFPDIEMTLIWDGAPYHRSGAVTTAAAEIDIELEPMSCL